MRFTQPPPQSVPTAHDVPDVQWPALQTWLAGHAVPQPPQFWPSLLTLAQVPLHAVKPGRHWQA
jgi:hypothetical protein